jgi:hypothetical protein
MDFSAKESLTDAYVAGKHASDHFEQILGRSKSFDVWIYARAFLRQRKIIFIIKTRHAISCAVNFTTPAL